MMDDLLRAERIKTADEVINAAQCVTSLRNALPTCADDDERRRVEAGVRHFEGEVRRLGERMLRLEAGQSFYPTGDRRD